MTPFDDWLRQLASAKKGPVVINIHRGLPFSFAFSLPGDWTGTTVLGAIRLAPDASGAVLVSFTVAGPVVGGGVSIFTLTLTKVQTAALPADDDANGVTEIAFDLLITPSGVPQQRLFGGVVAVLGKVSDAS